MLTIMQALKKIKHIDRKIEKTRERIQKWCSYIDPLEAPPQYDTNKLLQSVGDLLAEKARLRHALHMTNALHKVEYKKVKVTIDELLITRTITIPVMIETFKLQRRKEKPYGLKSDTEQNVVMQYDPSGRDRAIDSLENDLMEIDTLLDEVNITTDISQYLKA
ncbi:hypothetical protein LCGC14_2331590 [marine sediment metagenome]|uniref:Uncharacterized protein n=1 Tax=marine sediment metagenome TaxID=412755 RepID=A0A0F9CEP8_9ZZZZ